MTAPSTEPGVREGCHERPPNGAAVVDVHLATDHLLADIERRAVSGGLVTFTSQGVQSALNLASIVVLARLLDPKDFGLVAMVLTVTGFLQVFGDSGLSRTTVQREGITHAQVSNLFWINVAISLAIGTVLAVASPLLAWFYREPRLVSVTLLLAATFPLSGLTFQHTALLVRRMRFRMLAVVQVTAQLAGFCTGVTLAWQGLGYWALVIMQLATVATTLVLTYLAVPWRPQAPRRSSGTRPLLAFGSHLAGGAFVFAVARGFDGLTIGRIWGPDALGLYSRGGALLKRPMDQVMTAAEAVLVPMLSRIQHQPARYRSTFLQVYEAAALAGCLVTGLVFALARPVTLTVLGPAWNDASPVLAGFALGALSAPLSGVASWLFVTQGRGRGMLMSTVVASGVFVLSVAAGLTSGAAGVAVATSVGALVLGVPGLFYLAGREGPVTTADLWRGFLRYVPLWLVVCGSTYLALTMASRQPPLIQLLICAPTGLLAGAAIIASVRSMRRTALGVLGIVRQFHHPAAKAAADASDAAIGA